jgi:6-phosphogluconolactonase (cycloisomerase 2 family)
MGIYLGSLNLSTGQLDILRLVAPALPATANSPATSSPSTLVMDSSGTHLYAGNEYGPPGAVSAYAINRLTGDLTLLNVQPSKGASAHVGLGGQGRYLLAAEYSGSTFEVFPIRNDGALLPAVQTITNVGNVGPRQATNAPPGSFAISGHDAPHPHQMDADPSQRWVLGTDLGQDRIYVFSVDLTPNSNPALVNPPLTPAAIPFVTVPPGDGPRHFAFHSNGVWMYSIQEEANTVIFWRFNANTGDLIPMQQLSTLPPGFAGTDFTSEIRVSSDDRFVYGANRTHDTIVVFQIGSGGFLTRVGETSTLGDYPRTFTIDPTGQFMLVGNQRGDNITSFKIDQVTGNLTFTGDYTAVAAPSAIVFLT